MRKERPASATVFGILSIVGGTLSLLLGLWGAFVVFGGGDKMMAGGTTAQAQQQEKMKKDMEARLNEKVPFYNTVTMVNMAFELLLSLAMIVSGIGLVRFLSWGRGLSILYAVVSLVSKVVMFFFLLLVTVPVMVDFANSLPQNNQLDKIMATTLKVAAYATPGILILYGIYPALLLMFMFRGSVVRAFSTADGGVFDDEATTEYERG